MKKAGVWILLLGILLSAAPVFGAAGPADLSDVAGLDCEWAVRELVNLNIMEGYEDGTFRPEVVLNRAEFSALIARVLGLEQSAGAFQDQMVFQDVAPDYWAAGYIHAVAGLGIINGYGDGTFGPEDPVTLEQACKMVLECMGYGILAAENGGYPAGYIATAAQYGLTRDITLETTAPLPRGDAAMLLAQALDVDLIEREYGSDTYARQPGVTLRTKLCEQLDLEQKEGIVTANSYTSLQGSTGMVEGRIAIDGEVYRVGQTGLDNLLGYRVEYYASTSGSGATSLYSIQPAANRNQMVSFLPEEIDEIQADAFSVFQEGSGRATEYQLDLPVQTVYNGKYMPDAGREDWDIQNGRIRLLDNDGDEQYELVFVDEIETYLVGSVDAEKELINLNTFSSQVPNQFDGKTYIDCQGTDPLVRFCNVDGEALELADIAPMQLIGVLQSEDGELVTVISGTAPFDGTVDAVDETEAEVVIDGESYDLAKNDQGVPLLELNPGDEGRFWLDVMGRVAAKNITTSANGYGAEIETVNQDLLCSYLLDASSEGTFTPLVQFKLLTNLKDGTREERVFQLADTVLVNGEKTEAGDVLSVIADANDGDYHIPMTYELNGKGKIKSLWLYTQTIPMGYMTYQSATDSFDGLYYLDEDSITYYVDIRDFETVYPDTAIQLSNGYRYQVRIFDPVGEAFEIKKRIFIVHVDLEHAAGTSLDENAPLLVSNVAKYADEDGEIVYRLDGFCDGQAIQLSLDEDLNQKAEQLGAGSLIRFSKNAIGRVQEIKILATLPPEESFRKGIGGSNEQVYGDAVWVDRNADHSSCVLTVSYLHNGTDKQAAYEIAGKPVYLYERGKVSLSDTGSVGEQEKVFLQVVNFDVKAVVIIR